MHLYTEFKDEDIQVKIFVNKKAKSFIIRFYKNKKMIKQDYFSIQDGLILNPQSTMLYELNEKVEGCLKELQCQG